LAHARFQFETLGLQKFFLFLIMFSGPLLVYNFKSSDIESHSSGGVLPSVVCPKSVIAKPRTARPWTGIGSKRHRGEGKDIE